MASVLFIEDFLSVDVEFGVVTLLLEIIPRVHAYNIDSAFAVAQPRKVTCLLPAKADAVVALLLTRYL